MPWVYILKCRDDSFYTGSTFDLPHRFREHFEGKGPRFTRKRLPVQLAWAQEFERIDDAYVVEHQIKGWSRRKKIALIEGQLDQLPLLSKQGMAASDRPLSADARARIAELTQRLLDGGNVAAHNPGFDPAPVDAVTRQGSRNWMPRSQRFQRRDQG